MVIKQTHSKKVLQKVLCFWMKEKNSVYHFKELNRHVFLKTMRRRKKPNKVVAAAAAAAVVVVANEGLD